MKGWSALSQEEQCSAMKMNHLFCGFHFIVGLADQASSCLKEWVGLRFEDEKYGALEVPRVFETKESRVARLIHTATLEKHGDEQGGATAHFHAYLQMTNTPSPLANFHGNRNYVAFYNGAGVYVLHKAMLHFLQDVHGESNLLKAVKADLVVPDLVAWARALGFLCKLPIAPLWRVQEDKHTSIFDMSNHYTSLHK